MNRQAIAAIWFVVCVTSSAACTDGAGGDPADAAGPSATADAGGDAATPAMDARLPDAAQGDADLDSRAPGSLDGGDTGTGGNSDGGPGSPGQGDGSAGPGWVPDGAIGDGAVVLPPDASLGDGGVQVLVEPCAQIPAQGDTLFDLGISNYLRTSFVTTNRLLTQGPDRWILWDLASGQRLASGVHACTRSDPEYACSRVRAQEPVFVVPTVDALSIRSLSDGAQLGSVSIAGSEGRFDDGSQFGIADDGTFVWTATRSELRVHRPDGNLVISRPGNYTSARAFGRDGVLRVAMGGAIETITLATQQVSTAPFSGSFRGWFGDGGRFMTVVGSAIRVYSAAAVQEKLMELPEGTTDLGGWGDYLWISRPGSFQIFRVGGSDTPAFDSESAPLSVAHGPQLFFAAGLEQRRSVDLRNSTLVSVPLAVPQVPFGGWYSPVNARGDLTFVSGATVYVLPAGANQIRTYGCGQAASITMSNQGRWAIAVEHQILYGRDRTLEGVIPESASKVQLSADGTKLVALQRRGVPMQTNPTLLFFTLPSGARTEYTPSPVDSPRVSSFELSPDGSRIAELWCGLENPSSPCETRLKDLTNGALIRTMPWQISSLEAAHDVAAFSPSGARAAILQGTGVQIYEGASLVGAGSGFPTAWLNEDQLLVALIRYCDTTAVGPCYFGAEIVNREGTRVAGTMLPDIRPTELVRSLQNGARIFARNDIYDVATGAKLWEFPGLEWSNGSPQVLDVNETHGIGMVGHTVVRVAHP